MALQSEPDLQEEPIAPADLARPGPLAAQILAQEDFRVMSMVVQIRFYLMSFQLRAFAWRELF